MVVNAHTLGSGAHVAFIALLVLYPSCLANDAAEALDIMLSRQHEITDANIACISTYLGAQEPTSEMYKKALEMTDRVSCVLCLCRLSRHFQLAMQTFAKFAKDVYYSCVCLYIKQLNVHQTV